MPSRPLSTDRSTVVKLQTRLDKEAIDIAEGRTEMPAAVPRLVRLVPPARVDLVDEVVDRRPIRSEVEVPATHATQPGPLLYWYAAAVVGPTQRSL